MRRLTATIIRDMRLQLRNGFYYAAAFVGVFWMLGLRWFEPEQLRFLMPVFVLSNLLVNTFYFMAGMVLLEKSEGSLAAQIVTPLRNWEYLASKMITLTFLTLLETFLIVSIGFRGDFNPVALIVGVSAAAALFALAGFLAVSRYDSINEFLFPSMLYTLAAVPPFLQYLGIWSHPVLVLHPVQPALLLTQAAFEPISGFSWILGVILALLWPCLLMVWAKSVFSRFAALPEGGQG